MLLEENRNCGCGIDNTENENNLNNTMNNYNNESDRRVDCQQRKEMIEQIRCHEFAIVELALFLDTHPEDQKALCLHNKYCREVKELKDKYQKIYGPLTINYPCNKWRWLEEPWPWERGNY